MTLKNGFHKCLLFVLSANGWKGQNMDSSFSAKENPNMEKALFDWPIVLQYDVKAISRKFFGHEVYSAKRSLNQPKARCICIHSINQSNGFISVRLLFLFCSRVFISRSYEIIALKFKPNLASLHKSNGVIFTPDFSNLTITQTDLLSKLIGGCKNADSTVCELKVN